MISIVVPVFNAADTLDEAVQSALHGGVPGQEIVLVDDGSTDGSAELINGYQGAHSNVVALTHDRNRGGGAARNTGIRAAKHDIILVLDSDDVMAGNGTLSRALDVMKDSKLDGAATGRSIYFRNDIDTPERVVDFHKGPVTFEGLVSHTPSPAIINGIFRKAAFEKVGGYPDHHGLDTQGFGFRLLANKMNIEVLDDALYFQRLPRKPSYYVREARSGNVNRNWFYILIECLYKFRPEVRSFIASFDYQNPRLIAKGRTIFSELADRAEAENIFSAEGLLLADAGAYEAFKESDDPTLQMWCASFEVRHHNVGAFFERLDRVGEPVRRAMYPLIAKWSASGGLSHEAIAEFQYFFGKEKPMVWRARRVMQRVLNKAARLLPTE